MGICSTWPRTPPLRCAFTAHLFATVKCMPWCRTGKRAVVHNTLTALPSDSESEGGGGGFDGGEELIRIFDRAVNFVTENAKASISGVSAPVLQPRGAHH